MYTLKVKRPNSYKKELADQLQVADAARCEYEAKMQKSKNQAQSLR